MYQQLAVLVTRVVPRCLNVARVAASLCRVRAKRILGLKNINGEPMRAAGIGTLQQAYQNSSSTQPGRAS
jgi:hypothetical protein